MKNLKATVAILAISAFPLVAAAPAMAVDFDRLDFPVDCLLEETNEDDHVLAPGETLTITLENCAGYFIREIDSTENATMTTAGVLNNEFVEIPGGVVSVTVDGAADIDFNQDPLNDGEDFDIDIDVYIATAIEDPDSTLLATETVTLHLDAPETMIREEMIGDPAGDSGDGDIYLGGVESCELEPGLHVYETLEFTVTESGTFDFRAVGVNPLDEDLNWGVDKFPSSDPFVALYEGFDPSSPESGIVGCNDDGDDNPDHTDIETLWNDDYLLTETGAILEGQFPWFRSDLEPGEYTLVYLPFSAMGTVDFAQGQFDPTAEEYGTEWEPTAQSVTYEMWGPEGGLELGHALADTGVEPTFALWTGLALAGTGVAITVARRRTQRD